MPNPTRRWRRDSTFGEGPRQPMDRERKAVWKCRLAMHCRAGRITDAFEKIGLALLRRLGTDGRLDPSHETIAGDAGKSIATVKRALGSLQELGLVWWVRRLIREGWRVEQISNSYVLAIGNPPVCTDAQSERAIGKLRFHTKSRAVSDTSIPASTIPQACIVEARAALAEVAARRQAAVLAAITAKRMTRPVSEFQPPKAPDAHHSAPDACPAPWGG